MRYLALVPLALALGACCSQPGPMPALVVRPPIGIQMEDQPAPMRAVPAYSRATYSAPQIYGVQAAPCAPAAYDPCP